MNRNVDAVLRYWRTSLADGALGEGKFSQRDRQRFIELSSVTLRIGLLPMDSVSRLFKDQPKAKTVGVRFWPLVVARRLSHGAARGDGLPELVAPVATEALVDRVGKISPQRNTIARDLLTPLPSDEFTIGAVEALDSFLTAEPLQLGDPSDWAAYLAHCRKMVDAVAKGWPEGDQYYRPAGFGLLEPAEDASATVRNILDLYDKILANRPEAPLLYKIVSPVQGSVAEPKVEKALARRLGHSNRLCCRDRNLSGEGPTGDLAHATRSNSARPSLVIRFKILTPMAASVRWLARVLAFSFGPMTVFQRPIWASIRER